jgi:fatty acid desaturase
MSNIFDIRKVCFTFGKSNFTIMKSRLLFPHRFKLLGWLLALPGFVLGYLVVYNGYEIPHFGLQLRAASQLFLPAYENFTNELALTLVVAGLIFIAFSKQKTEDELTARIRLNALYWAILVNYLLYALFLIVVAAINEFDMKTLANGIDAFLEGYTFMTYNLFTPLVIFTARFYYLLYKRNDEYVIKPTRFLANRPYRLLGQLLTLVIGISVVIQSVRERDITWVFYILPLAMLIWVFSKEKQEDEYINAIRLDAMQIAVYANYLILLIANFTFYSTDFLLIMVFNLATIPTIFLIVFHYRLYKIRQADTETGKNTLNINIL